MMSNLRSDNPSLITTPVLVKAKVEEALKNDITVASPGSVVEA